MGIYGSNDCRRMARGALASSRKLVDIKGLKTAFCQGKSDRAANDARAYNDDLSVLIHVAPGSRWSGKNTNGLKMKVVQPGGQVVHDFFFVGFVEHFVTTIGVKLCRGCQTTTSPGVE